MTSSQDFIPIENTYQDMIFFKDGSVGLLLSVSAVNFALLFETEQISIIDSFAGLINSLSFPIQIVIYSKVMDVSSYLQTIDKALAKQTNPLLKNMTIEYRSFVEKSIKDNNVLDKKFYICIKITSLEIGLLPSDLKEKTRKVTTLIGPRRDHLVRQLTRLGLKTKQLNSEEIVKLFYEIYNPPLSTSGPEKISPLELATSQKAKPEEKPQINPNLLVAPSSLPGNVPPKLRPIKTNLTAQIPQAPAAIQTVAVVAAPPQASPPTPTPPQTNIPLPTTTPIRSGPTQSQLASPFVVEELPDDSGS